VTPQSGRTQWLDEIYELLRTARARKEPVAAMYEGHPRLFCPHVLGKNKQGRRNAFCYQFGGTSDSGLKTVAEGVGGWRCIVVEKLSGGELQSGVWHMEPRSNRQTCVEEVDFDADVQRGEDPQ
jgi:hypothetical protein